jgi:hypothetical protein
MGQSIDVGEERMVIRGWHDFVSKMTRHSRAIACALLAVFTLWMTACGGSSNSKSTLPVSILVAPGTTTLQVGQSQAFSATVSNSSNSAVSWSIQEGTAGGTITAAGVYTAPMKAGSYHVVATSVADTSKTATAAISATAPAPAFTSTAPASASEGVVYTYAPTATDPVKTAIKFSVASGPSGAAFSGNTLTWTPTHAQSRSANSFDIIATTDAGGTVHQTFTVTPTGTIRGTAIDTYVTATGNVTAPEDLTAAYIGVSYLNGKAWTTVQGIGNSDGTFTVNGVPSGYYWLAISSGGYWTSASDLDLGQDFLGRPDTASASSGTALALSFVALDTWQLSDAIDIYNPNLGQDFDWSDNLNPGDTVFGSTWDWTGPLSNAGKGDQWYVTQSHTVSQGSVAWRYGARTTPAIAITQEDASSTDLSGTLAPASPQTIHLALQGSQFASAAGSMGANATIHATTVGVYVQPFSSDKGAIGEAESLLETEDQTPLATDVDFGDLGFGNSFPASWSPFVSLTYEIALPVTAKGASSPVQVPAELYLSGTQLPTKDTPLSPAITPVLNVKLNGAALAQSQAAATLTPTLTWDPPATGVPTGYRVTVNQLTANGSQSAFQPLLDLFTNDHSIVIPEGVLTAGNEYFFTVRAYLAPKVDFTTAPYHAAFPWSHADLVTPVVSTVGASSNAISAGPTALQHVLRGALTRQPRAGNARQSLQHTTPRVAVVPPK